MDNPAGLAGAADSARIERLDLHLLRVPLKRPYRLAFGDLLAFDTLLVEVTDVNGRSGFGEATLLPGYSGETVAGAWNLAQLLSEAAHGATVAGFRASVDARSNESTFVATAFSTALEMLASGPALALTEPTRVPLLGLLNAIDEGAIADEFESLLNQGFGTIKVKVGLSGVDDLARVAAIQRVVRGRARIRIDANQAFSADAAIAFLSALDPQDIELFEQPCPADDWEAHAAAARASRVPLMLDESIFTVADIDRAADQGLAAFLKVKLVKFCSVARLERAVLRIRERGLQPVLGNGVACDVGCWMEACVAARHIDNAGEMNGYLKPTRSLLANPPRFEAGAMWLPPDYVPVLDRESVRQSTVATQHVRRELHGVAR